MVVATRTKLYALIVFLLAVLWAGFAPSGFAPSAFANELVRGDKATSEIICGLPHGTDEKEWPRLDETKCIVDKSEFLSGGVHRDAIAAISRPLFVDVADAALPDNAPVIQLVLAGEARAYPLAIMVWHEIVNDEVAGVPLLISFCPLCNTALAFDRRLQGEVLQFGTTGYLRHSDLVMYDRKSESWWQQYGGRALLGKHSGKALRAVPVSVVGFAQFRNTHPQGKVLVPNDVGARAYGVYPYRGYEEAGFPIFYRGEVPRDVSPLARVVVAGDKAWTLDYIRTHAPFRAGDLLFEWRAGQVSGLGEDIGTAFITKGGAAFPHHTAFAFVVYAFEPEREIIY